MKYIEKSDGFYITENGEMYRHGKKLTLHSSGKGLSYYRQRIYNLDGSMYRVDVHRLVATHFLPNPNNLPVVNHKNGLKRDNRVENLEWCTVAHNVVHSFETGLNNNVLENHHQATLTNEQVHKICQMMQDGWRNCEICKEFGIPKTIPTNIRNGICWIEISSKYNVRRQRRNRLGVGTVNWICSMLQEGNSPKAIVKMASSDSVTLPAVYAIYYGYTWKQISSNYKF